MKSRSGFVSNSSSCSFILLGVHLDKDQLEKLKTDLGNDYWEKLEELDIDYIYDDETDGCWMGDHLADFSDEDYESGSISAKDLENNERTKKVQELLTEHSITANELKLFYGLRSC